MGARTIQFRLLGSEMRRIASRTRRAERRRAGPRAYRKRLFVGKALTWRIESRIVASRSPQEVRLLLITFPPLARNSLSSPSLILSSCLQ
ncbi:hypothetical protein C1W84_26025 [Burkholderia pseudomallei]|nr:hypothetical protein [Burkholderia pseudomallei]MWA33029.1 hypothetical protein [Burkholderia pseudomallei]NAW76061.1 hypothetical protein [Burkholderia pseudomallei]NAX60882.1 hypothetical protein [Burkholderia pseudomallei]NAX69935.1 hypothetical protein [Burkholderia pseudomallei]